MTVCDGIRSNPTETLKHTERSNTQSVTKLMSGEVFTPEYFPHHSPKPPTSSQITITSIDYINHHIHLCNVFWLTIKQICFTMKLFVMVSLCVSRIHRFRRDIHPNMTDHSGP